MEKNNLDLIFTELSGLTTPNKQKYNTKSKYFITYQSYFSVEINAHSLIYLAVLVSEGQLPLETLNIWLQNSQTCESTFRSTRSISSINSAGVNFTVSQFLNRINKLSTLQNIKINTNENKLHFPQHHKVSSSSLRSTSNSSNTTIISKADIENSVLNAYKYVTNLFKPLQIKQLLRNGQTISIQELSNTISRRLENFWIAENDDSNSKNADLDTESDEETDNSIHKDVTYDNDSDEEIDPDDSYDTTHNFNISAHRGIRLVDNVKEEFAHTYFQVIINGDKNIFINKLLAGFCKKIEVHYPPIEHYGKNVVVICHICTGDGSKEPEQIFFSNYFLYTSTVIHHIYATCTK
ncbi:unnamed protein product [Rotaria sp. Silwood2]|nr:unnamed protein product [Rotaria sp. Silwood2]CAF2975225.1 unnamed protein product [Rotaria sp. Silwood2]CAF4300301.1 unnamed protein product [Rotaria sp. Silwood2]CAF4302055.1 unnamed protein product [Rotaria sp. Silwood2]CAF4395905.1 unnamed protein product [Rotaria sp. Silwood2]